MPLVAGLIVKNLLCAPQARGEIYDRAWTVPQPSGNDPIIVGVLHYLVTDKGWKSYFDFKNQRNYVTIDKKDPSDYVLRSFHSTHRFYKGSDCSDTHQGVFEKESKKPARLARLKDISVKGDTASVAIWLRSVGWGGRGTRLTVAKLNGEWKVTGQGRIMKG